MRTKHLLPLQALDASNKVKRRAWLAAALLGSLSMGAGCTTTPGARPSIWPTKTVESATSASTGAGMTGSIASTTQAVKGQFASMGTAMTSAYEKTKTAITSPFTGTTAASGESSDPTSLSNKSTIGPELHVMNGQLHESQGNYAKALDAYSKALEIEPKNASALLSTARLYDRQNEKDKAIEFYQKASTVAPNNAATFAELGNLYAKNGNLTAARGELQKAVNLDPKSTTYRSSLAGVMLDSGNAEAAMSELQQVNAPAMANYQMAYLYFARKNIPATQQHLTSALQIDPNLKPARDLMASIGGTQNVTQVAQQGQQMYQQAQGIYQQAGAIGSNIQGLMQGGPAWGGASTASPTTNASPASATVPLPSTSGAASHQEATYPSQTIRR